MVYVEIKVEMEAADERAPRNGTGAHRTAHHLAMLPSTDVRFVRLVGSNMLV